MQAVPPENPPRENWQDGPLWKWIVLLMLALATGVALFARFRAGSAFVVFFDDDYFYYLQIARHIAAGRGSTFDGIHLTNGYHPLWLLVNVGLVKFFSGRLLFEALLAVIFLCVLAVYGFTRASLRVYASEAAAAGCAALVAGEGLLIMSGGMEVVLALPLLALLCWYRIRHYTMQPRNAAIYGVLCSALVLTRLDAALFVALLAGFELLAARNHPRRQIATTAVAFMAGLLPLLAYFAVNVFMFHTLMPVSGQAKQLRFSHQPSSAAWATALFAVWAPLRLILVIPVLCAVVWSILLLRRHRSNPRGTRLACDDRALVWALLCFPVAQLTTLSIVSDWVLPPWYLYTFVGAAFGVCTVLLSRGHRLGRAIQRLAAPLSLVASAMLLTAFALVQWRNSTRPDKIIYSVYFAARDLNAFAGTHPGLYAMGDHAGVPGLLLQQPILQTEGLVMDKPFLRNIRQQQNLTSVLERYGVRYYVASNPATVHGCLQATEPSAIVAGPTSYLMRGTFCSAPVLHFSYSGRETYVIDLQREPASSP